MIKSIFRIKKYCAVRNHTLLLNGKPEIQFPEIPFLELIEKAYNSYQINYPKFFKMDNLSKLGFVTAELLLKDLNLKENYDAYKTGIILSNKSSSLDTDVKYDAMVKKGISSPAVFVYSLPNIVIGEISIRNGIKGENSFFISDKYDISFQVNYINNLLNEKVMDACICGRVELMGENYESFLYLVENNPDENYLPHTVNNVESIYNN